MKRYHFVEVISCYWKGVRIRRRRGQEIEKPYTPFSYRRRRRRRCDNGSFAVPGQLIVLPTARTVYPDGTSWKRLLRRYKADVTTYEKPHATTSAPMTGWNGWPCANI